MAHDSSLAAFDLNLLVVLRALLSERHVTRAAARVGLSQSATSHALARLRELYVDPLLVRNGRSLELTPRAKQLLPTLERGLSDLKVAIEAEPDFDPTTTRRSFTLGMADYTQAVTLGPVLRALEQQAPHIALSVLNPPNLEAETIAGNVDLGLHVSGDAPPKLLSSERLFEDEFVCLVRRDHPRIRAKLTLEHYLASRHVVVAPSGRAGSLVDTVLERRGLERKVALRLSNFLVVPLVLSQTDFVSTMPRRLALGLAARHGLRLLPTPIALPRFGFSLLWHPRLDHDPAQRWLRELVAKASAAIARTGKSRR